MRRISKLAVLAVLTILLAACSSTYRTYYANPIDPGVARSWRVTDVVVNVPDTLSVSEAKVILPQADIVWREDPMGDRRAQVARLMREAARRGVSGLRGSRPVRLQIDMTRFHALTFEAEARLNESGVHNIDFVATVLDARTGAVLAGPEVIQAETPAFSGPNAVAARAAGQTQRSVITNHVAATLAGWVGTGPDQRREFTRLGD